ncbi:Uncharacterised protein [Mycobacterium tuberculosis]|uniref:Uncharacterized protein n=1 Tax=Mycobacterium tuberculosis TaxID=1773 RepID=A0A916LHX2_MYCTX|nr:Uncharacterised protein [Mycobacterium tuberculosis]COY49059.1 Uncharacterised protein [Mycobacterium tuberculosis]CPA38040.1 Uncharacterised protein [Mycobacterium tuberculosis]CPC31798.1 Uncharacterised protein [Mycobacterium tuberculosis]
MVTISGPAWESLPFAEHAGSVAPRTAGSVNP